jgi:hypothetical protein
MLRSTLLAAALTSVASWATCEFPSIDWIVVDSGTGKSATQKVTTLGTDTFIGGYAGGTTILSSSVEGTQSVTNTETGSVTNMDMHISKITDAGAPTAIYIFEGEGLGSNPGWGTLKGMEDGVHIAAATSVSANLTVPGHVKFVNAALQGSTGLVVKLKGSDGSVPWYKAFAATAGSSVYSVDGDAAGNMYVHYSTCVPCVGDSCSPETDRYGRPTGFNAPTCTRSLAMLNAADGTEGWKVDLPAATATTSINPGQIRLKATGNSNAAAKMYAWGSVKGTAVILNSCNITSASSGTASQAVLFEFDATDGSCTWATAPTGDTAISSGYLDVSPSATSPVIAVQGSFSGTVAFGSTSVTASMGYYTSFVARLSATDGSVVWADQTPMGRGVQATPDGAYIGVFAQTTGTTDSITLTDTGGATTTMRSRGSWDLIAMKYSAVDGTGIYALDGGGDGMEYFHGFGMNSQGDMLISGYSRSSSFHFGDHSLPNNQTLANGGDGQNKVFTIQVNAAASTPSCIASCASNTPVIAANKCFIDNYCYADQQVAPYPARACFKCDVATNTGDWTGPDVTDACYFGGSCYASGESKPSGRGVSACEACLPSKSTEGYSVRDFYDLEGSSCVALTTVSTTSTEALTAAMAASTKVSEITGAIGDFAAAKALYVGSVLQTLATTSWAGTTDFDQAAAYFGSATWLDDYVLSALEGTGEFAGTLEPASRGDMSAARTEAVKKGLQDQILVMAALSVVATDPTVEANWDLAYAYYHGDNPSGAPYARANKRASNYGTKAADGTTAKLNFKIMDAIAAGKTACTAGTDGAADATAAAAAAADFRALVLGIYYQAALRYAYKIDNAMIGGTATADYQGEGGAFWRVVAPLMNSKDPLLSQYVADFYNMANAPSAVAKHYCPTLYLLSNHLLDGFTATDMGSLASASAVVCMNGIQLAAAPSAAVLAAAAAGTEVKMVTGSSGLGNATDPFGKAKAKYISTSLDELAKQAYTSSYFTTASAYFGSATWIDDYMLTALDATGQFAGTLDSARGDMSAARTEAVKKGAQDQILFNSALGSLVDPTAAASWYLFYAYWTGDTPSGAPWARANKRCKNYATCGGGTTGGGGELATTNTKILLATLSALENPTANGAAAKVEAVAQAKIVYYQAALRYSYLLDDDITNSAATADHQGEGGAFWRVIEAEMAGIDAATSAYVTRFYTMTTVPAGTGRYCVLSAMLHANMPGNYSVAEMGVLQGSSVTLPTCPAVITADTEGAKKTTLVIVAPGTPSDYDEKSIGSEFAAQLGVSPASVQVTVAAASRRRRLQSSGVTITIDVFTTEAAAAAMVTSLTAVAGTPALASAVLSAATGTTVTITAPPEAPTTSDATAVEAAAGLSTGALIAIIVGVLVAVVAVVVIIFMMKKKPKTTPGKASSASA